MRRITRMLAVFLVLVLLTQGVAPGVLAAAPGAKARLEDPVPAAPKEASEETAEAPGKPFVQGELVERRGEQEKHFRMSDGSFLAVDYGVPVHYSPDGETWENIDNTLLLREEAKDAGSSAHYAAENGEHSSSFAASLESGALFSVSFQDAAVRVALADAPDGQPFNRASEAEITQPEKLTESSGERTLAQQLRPALLESSVLYRDVWPGADLRYLLSGYNVKESIVLNEPCENCAFSFVLSLDALTPELAEDGSIELLDAEGRAAYRIPTPYMTDADGALSNAVSYTLTQREDGWLLTVAADPEWLGAEGRAYPVEIDPTVVYRSNSSNPNILTSYVNSDNPSTVSFNNTGFLRSGYYLNTDQDPNCKGHTVGLIYVNDLPSVPSGCVVTSAYLEFTQVLYGGVNNYGYHRLYATTISTPSDPAAYLSGMTWNSYVSNIYSHYWKPNASEASPALDYSKEFYSPGKKTVYTITGAAKRWYDPADTSISRLLVLDNGHTSTTNARVTYAGKNYGVSSYEPKIYVSYRNTTGLDDISTYHTQNVGRAGVGYVNDYTLQTSFVVPLISQPSEALPFSLSLIYNEGLSNAQFTKNTSNGVHTAKFGTSKMGYGWKLSAQQTVQSISLQNGGSTTTWLVYTDGDGTEHYFAKESGSSIYHDEEGLNLKITGSAAAYTMTDKGGNTWIFTYGYLTSFTDANGNALYYAYDGIEYPSTGWKPTNSSSDHQLTGVWRKNDGGTLQRLATIAYANGHLSYVDDAANRRTLFYYNNSNAERMTSVRFPDNVLAEFSYSASGGYYRLTQATDNEANYRIEYTYQNEFPLRAHVITEKKETQSGVWEEGARIRCYLQDANYSRFRYFQAGDTDPTSQGQFVTLHYFDNIGRCVNALTMNAAETEILGISVGTYTDNSGTAATNNRLTAAAVIGMQPVNLVLDGGLETSAPSSFWEHVSGPGTVSYVSSYNSLNPRTGSKMMKLASSQAGKTVAAQDVYLVGGTTYVFSGYVNTLAATCFDTCEAALEFQNSAGERIETSSEINYATNSEIADSWARLQVAFCPSQSGKYRIAAVIQNYMGVVLFDDFQLEAAPNDGTQNGAASTLNLLQFGSFDRRMTNDGSSSYSGISNWWSYQTSSACPSTAQIHSGGYSMTFAPGVDAKRRVVQTIPIHAPASQTYLLSAWGKTPQTNLYDGKELAGDNSNDARFFGVIAKLEYENSAYAPDYFYLSFNGDISEWQYSATMIVPKQAQEHPNAVVSQITLTGALDYCANRAYIDDLSLTAEPIQTYTYDTDGNLIAATNSEGKTATEYDDSDRLTKYTAINGVDYTLSYVGSSRNPNTVVTDGLTTSYTYDAAGNVTQTGVTSSSTTKTLQSSAGYDDTKNYQTSATDANGISVSRFFGQATGYLLSLTAPTSGGSSVTTQYEYDTGNGRPTATYQSGTAALNYNYNDDGSLRLLSRKSYRSGSAFFQAYSFTYDGWGNTTQIEVSKPTDSAGTLPSGASAMTLASYTYNPSGTKASMTCPNGNYVLYFYDAFDRLCRTVYYNREATPRTVQAEYIYVYNANGTLARQYEVKNNQIAVEYVFEYDSLGRLIQSRETAGNTTRQRTDHVYDTANRLTAQSWALGGSAFSESYTYNSGDGSLNTVTTSEIGSAANHYDALKRPDKQTLATKTGTNYTKWISYADSGNTAKTQISSFAYRLGTSSSGTLLAGSTYTYHPDGSIASIRNTQTGEKVTYSYDALGQLTHEKYYNSSNTLIADYLFVYDSAGNLLSTSVSTIPQSAYTYGNGSWADLLTGITVGSTTRAIAYEGQSVSGNTVSGTAKSGNPINWYNGTYDYYDLTWEQGRRLTELEVWSATDQTRVGYDYDMDGIRRSKSVENVTHTYLTQNGKVVQEAWGANVLQFFYDVSGNPFALRYSADGGSSWRTYYYILNLQGDVVALIYADGTVCASYEYDAWGAVRSAVTASGCPTANLAELNPLRYRGYYYDTETGWYYLQSRYYDPIVKRFINADSFASTGQGFLGYNVFAYCGNDPVSRRDSQGQGWISDAWDNVCEWVSDKFEDAKETVSDVVVDIYEETVSLLDRAKHFITNEDPKVCKDSVISMYKGSLVLNIDWDWAKGKLTSFSCGVIVLLNEASANEEDFERTLNHEYGHSVQFRILGPKRYLFKIAIPSMLLNLAARNNEFLNKNYYSMPTERSADLFGNVNGGDHSHNLDPYGYGSLAYLLR